MMQTWFHTFAAPEMFFPFPYFMVFPVMMVVAAWTVGIKGYALWHAARNEQKWWFVGLLLINVVGIPEIVYLIWFRTDRRAIKAVAPAPMPAPSSKED